MKLAEALILRADSQKRIEQLKVRLLRNAKVQEGEEPAEDPQSLLGELVSVADQLVDLIKRINKTNSNTALAEGRSIADALAERDVLVLRRGAFSDLAAMSALRQDRITRSEVKYISTIKVAEIQKQADDLAKQYREIDARIQEANWKTDLLD
jgi:hypothetical protein